VVGAFIIGDELLVGKRQDKHLPFLIGALAQRGLRLASATSASALRRRSRAVSPGARSCSASAA
jgi:hypothetical protein